VSHNIPVKSTLTKPALVNLFKDHIVAHRDAIISEYKAKPTQEKAATEAREELGRGHRVSRMPAKYDDEEVDFAVEPRRTDKDGFAIPAIPPNRRTPQFAPEDSFDEGESDSTTPVRPQLKSSIKKTTPITTFKETPAAPATPAEKKKAVRLNTPKFNAEDSFASSDDEQFMEPSKPRVPRKRSPPKESVSSTKAQKEPIAKETPLSISFDDEDDDDEDYLADSDEPDDEDDYDDDEDEPIDESEVNLLYRENALPIKKLPDHHMLTRAQKLADFKKQALVWKSKLKNVGWIFCSIYMIIAVFGLLFTTYARQQNGYCESTSTDQEGNRYTRTCKLYLLNSVFFIL
jgi:hypothetical protein